MLFEVGDRVEKCSGYKWPGVVVAVCVGGDHRGLRRIG